METDVKAENMEESEESIVCIVQENEDAVNEQHQTRKSVWTPELVDEFLNKIEENFEDFKDKRRRKNYLWKKIWLELCVLCPEVTLDQVQQKWRNMLLAVRRYDHSRGTNNPSRIVKPIFYNRLNDILGSSRDVMVAVTRKRPSVVKKKNLKSNVPDTASDGLPYSAYDTVSIDSHKSLDVSMSNNSANSPCISDSGWLPKSPCVTVFKANSSTSKKGDSKDNQQSGKPVTPVTGTSIITPPTVRVSTHKNFVLLKRPVSKSPRLSDSDTDERFENADIIRSDMPETCADDEESAVRDQTKVLNGGQRVVKINMLPRLKNLPQSSKSEALQILNSINEKLEKIVTSKGRQQLQFQELLKLSKERNRMLAEKNKLLRELMDGMNKNCQHKWCIPSLPSS